VQRIGKIKIGQTVPSNFKSDKGLGRRAIKRLTDALRCRRAEGRWIDGNSRRASWSTRKSTSTGLERNRPDRTGRRAELPGAADQVLSRNRFQAKGLPPESATIRSEIGSTVEEHRARRVAQYVFRRAASTISITRL